NSYEWFRKTAASDGTLPVGSLNVEVLKQDGIWFVDVAALESALASHREARENVHRNTRDHEKGIIHGADGDAVRTDWGSYGIRGQFRIECWDRDRIRHRSYGTWICNVCNKPAETKHDKKPCHRCTDWTGCGRDCT